MSAFLFFGEKRTKNCPHFEILSKSGQWACTTDATDGTNVTDTTDATTTTDATDAAERPRMHCEW